MIELLAPAGDGNKLRAAIHYGADAVYLGGKAFSLRAFAGNFSADEMISSLNYLHARGKKGYVTANIFPRNADFAELFDYFAFLQSAGADGALITDVGALDVCKKAAPKLPVHVSTQANTLNKYAVRHWANEGASRVVLARELSLSEIREIKDFVGDSIELEAFVHGAMCISYSGRCLLSGYLTPRDSNRGECVQACRWSYEMREKSRGGRWLAIEEDGRGSYVLNSRDLNMFSHVGAMIDAGVESLKIEGRMKSEYYVGSVVNAYRRLLDKGAPYEADEELSAELFKTSHRDYTTAYMLGANDETQCYTTSKPDQTYEFTALVRGYDAERGEATVEMRNRFAEGDELEILSNGEAFGKTITVSGMTDESGEAVGDAYLVQQRLRIKCPYPVSEWDMLRKKVSRAD